MAIQEALHTSIAFQRRRSRKQVAWQMKQHAALMTGALLLLAIFLLAALGPVFYSVDPLEQDLDIQFTPPLSLRSHILGTDQLGRDILSRLLHGARISLLVGVAAILGAVVVGVIIGLASGFYGGNVDSILMRIAEAEMAFPFIVLALLLLSVMAGKPHVLAVVFVVVGWPIYSKIARAQVLSLREEDFILAARAIGVSRGRIMARHLLPNLMPAMLVLSTLQFATVIFTEAGLSFIGVGIQPPTPSWGLMLAEGRQYIYTSWWLVTLPGLALMFTILAVNLVGDGLQDALDPRRRKGMG
jgi:peptide/nickel transport system permease protein